MMVTGASFSNCKKYRYTLTRKWNEALPTIVFIMLNTSTADETKDDPTIKRCIEYAKSWRYGKMIAYNIFAYRTTDPSKLKKVSDPIGEYNDLFIKNIEHQIICAWGNHGALNNRSTQVWDLIKTKPVYYLDLTKQNEPKHPLYLKKDLQPIRWEFK